MRLHTFCFAALALVAIAGQASAQSQAWEVWEEEDTTAVVSDADSNFKIVCVSGRRDPTYEFTTAHFVVPPGMRSPEMVLRIDDQEFSWKSEANPAANSYTYVGETMNPSDIAQINVLMAQGHQLTVSIPTLRVSSSFSLSGSGKAIFETMSVCSE